MQRQVSLSPGEQRKRGPRVLVLRSGSGRLRFEDHGDPGVATRAPRRSVTLLEQRSSSTSLPGEPGTFVEELLVGLAVAVKASLHSVDHHVGALLHHLVRAGVTGVALARAVA